MAVKETSQIEDLENQLFARLKPIQPRTEFVDHLKYRLENPPNMVVESPSWIIGVLILAGSLLGGFILYAVLRKIIRWLSR
ncbi:hypothetical protein LARV_02214 [Longilinea arvoryzae]|uniref:Uncharacterized protein n=1 Tax=Longilinea arvoryzae TaxID=360412 RepID=A0A0S7BFT8_9CHLR|nr:hypothetical protein [Longilinea arvoryzae]GAP14445.1 hypothetical protein LARV_02214 [Longilinea arvoryzae]